MRSGTIQGYDRDINVINRESYNRDITIATSNTSLTQIHYLDISCITLDQTLRTVGARSLLYRFIVSVTEFNMG